MRAGTNIEQQAAEWIVRRDRDPVSPDERMAFERWLAADARHRKVFLELQEPWRQADGLRKWRPYEGVLDARILKRYATSPARRPKLRYALAASVVAALAVTMWVTRVHLSAPQTYTTDVGGYERVILRDGSTLQLNTDSQVRVLFGPTSRTIRLMHGEVHFTVAQDLRRPFEVLAAGLAVRALGTSFTVRLREPQSVEVLVTEGRVGLNSQAGDDGHTLAAGESAIAKATGIVVSRVSQTESMRRLSWQSGELSFKGESLAQVVAEFNRYNREKLRIDDPRLANLQVGGNFKATDLASFTKALKSSFGLQTIETGDEIELTLPERQ